MNGETINADQVHAGARTRPHTIGLGLEAAGVAVNERGAIIVDDYSRTSVPHIFALGDVTDRVQLTRSPFMKPCASSRPNTAAIDQAGPRPDRDRGFLPA